MFRKAFYPLMVLVLVLSLLTPALTSGSGRVLAQEGAKSYIVVQQRDPLGSSIQVGG